MCTDAGARPGAHCGLDGAVATDDDDLWNSGAIERANLGEGFETVAVGQPDVEQNDIVGRIAE